MKWYLLAFKKYATFKGRSSRKEFWLFVLFNFIAANIIGLLSGLVARTTGHLVRSLASTASSRRTGRIFRDEEELHTSPDLTQSIRNALRDSTLHRRRTKTLRH
jgi:hypothetical protein